MNTTQSLNSKRIHQTRSAAGFTGKVRSFFREQQDAQDLLLEKQAPWLNRR